MVRPSRPLPSAHEGLFKKALEAGIALERSKELCSENCGYYQSGSNHLWLGDAHDGDASARISNARSTIVQYARHPL